MTGQDLQTPSERLAALRAELATQSLAGFVLPLADEYQSEYLPEGSRRLTWLTGFTGSAGTVAIYGEEAALFVDGRYLQQAEKEVDTTLWSIESSRRPGYGPWLTKRIEPGAYIGFDPRLHTINGTKKLSKAVGTDAIGILIPLDINPIDGLWTDRPPLPNSPVTLHPLTFAGVDLATKLDQVAAILRERRAAAVILNQPESVAWLLNLRGDDVPFTPLPLCQAIVDWHGRARLFLAADRLDEEARAALADRVELCDPDSFSESLVRLQCVTVGEKGGRVNLAPDSASQWLYKRLRFLGIGPHFEDDPCQSLRAAKNDTEIQGMRAAHVRDGVAVSRFLAWLSRQPENSIRESDAVRVLADMRREGQYYRGDSFATIAAYGPNGAIVHYRVTEASDLELAAGNLFLVDSGGQYLDGTTDVTRTVAIGQPTLAMRRHFTLVLKGHIALASQRFPVGTSGAQLDTLARQFLWAHGLDYDHGTGHGVGSYLGVHQGPQSFSAKHGAAPLVPGMVLSNEPGYYRSDAYGIRIESLMLVVPGAVSEDGRETLKFETLTRAPIDRRLIDPGLITPAEIRWLDTYHETVRNAVMPSLTELADRAWLHAATAPLLGGMG